MQDAELVIQTPRDGGKVVADLVDVDAVSFPEQRVDWEFRVSVSSGSDMTLLKALYAARDLLEERIRRIEGLLGRRP